jgi:hypothetical protein
MLATTGKQSQATLWDVRQHRQAAVNRLLAHPSSVAFAPNGAYYAVKNTRGEIVVCRVASGELVSRYKPDGQGEGCRILFSKGGDYLIDGSWKGRIDGNDSRSSPRANRFPELFRTWEGGSWFQGTVTVE